MTTTQEKKQAIYDAFYLLIQDRDNVWITQDHLLSLCLTDRSYAIQLIDDNSNLLLSTNGKFCNEISNLVYLIEWKLRGASDFLKHHFADPQIHEFIVQQLKACPSDFSRDDLKVLLTQYKDPDYPIRGMILELLSKNISSFAESISDEPIEISKDLESLNKSITDYGFTQELNEVLQKIDSSLQNENDAFDQVSTIKHIRSFFEKLHESVGLELQKRKVGVGNGTNLSSCGQAIHYLQRKNVITEKFDTLASCLYSILSDGNFGVHAIKANRDYTRLCRNMVIEYAVVLFLELERRLAEPGDM